MSNITIAEISKNLASGKYSSVEITQDFLQRVKQNDKAINSFITVTEEQALAQSKAADEQSQNGNASVLTGVPNAHKANNCTDDVLTSCPSTSISNFVAHNKPIVVEKLKK